jgi:hypothetical protein
VNIDQEMQQAMGTSADALNPQAPVDPVSGNAVPVGSEPKNVRDDIPAKLSEGEFIIPADVAKFYGMDKLYKMIDKAREQMAEMGPQVGDKVDNDTLPFPEEELQMAEGGEVPMRDYRAYAVDPDPNQNLGHAETQPGAGSGVDVKIFKDNTGYIRVVPFVNGQPIGEIPEGAVEQGSSSDAPNMTDTENRVSSGEGQTGKAYAEQLEDQENRFKGAFRVEDLDDQTLQQYYNIQKQIVEGLTSPAGKLGRAGLGLGLSTAGASGLGPMLGFASLAQKPILMGYEREMKKRGLTSPAEAQARQEAVTNGARLNYQNDRNDNNRDTNFGGSASNYGAGKPVSEGGSGAHPSYEKAFGNSDRNNSGGSNRSSERNSGGDWGGNDDSFSSGGLW